MIRFNFSLLSGTTVTAGNPPVLPAQSPIVLSKLTPLAFISAETKNGQAVATPSYNKDADNFFYAVISSEKTALQPDTLNLIYDHPFWTSLRFPPGQHVADVSLPLVVLNTDGTERQVATTVEVWTTCSGSSDCLTAFVVGGFLANGTKQTHVAKELGIGFAVEFGASPTSAHPHPIFKIQVPLLVTAANDPPYFAPNFDLSSITFSVDAPGYTPAFLGTPIGVTPVAALYSASFLSNRDDHEPVAGLSPAVAAYVMIGTDGNTLISAPLPQPPSP
jgi:hypothetical protein